MRIIMAIMEMIGEKNKQQSAEQRVNLIFNFMDKASQQLVGHRFTCT